MRVYPHHPIMRIKSKKSPFENLSRMYVRVIAIVDDTIVHNESITIVCMSMGNIKWRHMRRPKPLSLGFHFC